MVVFLPCDGVTRGGHFDLGDDGSGFPCKAGLEILQLLDRGKTRDVVDERPEEIAEALPSQLFSAEGRQTDLGQLYLPEDGASVSTT